MSQGGRGAEVSVSSTWRIGDLKVAAQKSLQQGMVEMSKYVQIVFEAP